MSITVTSTFYRLDPSLKRRHLTPWSMTLWPSGTTGKPCRSTRQNAWGWEGLWRSPGPAPLLEQGLPELLGQDHIHTAPEYLQGETPQSLQATCASGQSPSQCFSLCPLPLVPFLGTREHSPAPHVFYSSFRSLYILIRLSLSHVFLLANSAGSQPLLIRGKYLIFVALHQPSLLWLHLSCPEKPRTPGVASPRLRRQSHQQPAVNTPSNALQDSTGFLCRKRISHVLMVSLVSTKIPRSFSELFFSWVVLLHVHTLIPPQLCMLPCWIWLCSWQSTSPA